MPRVARASTSAAVDHEVIVVDNASSDGSADMVAADFPAVRLIAQHARTSASVAANNQAMRVAEGDWLLLLNSDTTLVDGSVAALFGESAGRPSLAWPTAV